MVKTFNRSPFSVPSPSSGDVKNYYFNHCNWKGLNDDKNVLTVDQETFEDCDNLYISDDGVLKSRPSLHISDVNVNEGNIVNIWNFENVIIRLVEQDNEYIVKIYNSTTSNSQELEIEDTVLTPILYKQYILLWRNSINDTYYYDIVNNSVDKLSNILYIPITTIYGIDGTKVSNESANELTSSYKTAYQAESVVKYPREMLGKDVSIKLDDTELQFNDFKELDMYQIYTYNDISKSIKRINYIKVASNGVILIYGEYTDGSDVMYYSLDQRLFTSINITVYDINGCVLSEDGNYVLVYNSHQIFIKSLLSTSEYGLKYPVFTELRSYSTGTGYILKVVASSDTTYSVLVDTNINSFSARGRIYYYDGDFNKECDLNYNANQVSIMCMTSSKSTNNIPVVSVFNYNSNGVLSYVLRNHANIVDYTLNYTSTVDIVMYDNTIRILQYEDTENFDGLKLVDLIYDYEYTEQNNSLVTSTYSYELTHLYNIYDAHLINNTLAGVYGSGRADGYAGLLYTLVDLSTKNISTIKATSYTVIYGSSYSDTRVAIVQGGVPGNTDYDIYTVPQNTLTFVSRSVSSNDDITISPYAYCYLENIYIADAKKLYISKEIVEDDLLKIYFPKINTNEFNYNITNLHPISDVTVAVFFSDNVWYCTYDSSIEIGNIKGAYRYVESKLQIGCEKYSNISTSYDSKYTIFPSKRGLAALSYQDFISTTEQMPQYVSDSIYSIFSKYISQGIKLYKYGFWLIIYKNTSNKLFILDMRNTSWWPCTVPKNISKIVTINDVPQVLIDGKLYKLNTAVEEYYDSIDNVNYKIDWKFVSQKLHLNAINNYKHIINITTVSSHEIAPSSDINIDTMNNKLNVRIYRKKVSGNLTDERDYIAMSYNISAVRTFVQRLNYSKVNEFQYRMSVSDDAIQIPLSLNNIGIKYNVGGQVR